MKCKKFIIQWHITDRCNLRCLHCYQDSFSSTDLPMDKLLYIYNSCLQLVGKLSGEKVRYRLHLNFTGGEPLLRPDFLDLLSAIRSSEQGNELSFGILTNGTILSKAIIAKLKELEVSFVQVSIEGNKKTHNQIRGNNNFQTVKNNIKKLAKSGIRVYVSFTASKANYKEFGSVARLARSLKVDKLWADRYVPISTGREMHCHPLTTEEFQSFIKILSKEQIRPSIFSKTQIAANRALQFQATHKMPYKCSAGRQLLAVMQNGDVYPCRRLPIKIGNVLDESLYNLYQESAIAKALRNEESEIEGCAGCSFQLFCQGGARCLTYALRGTIFEKDPNCSYRLRSHL